MRPDWISVRSKPVVLWQKENGIVSSVTTYTPEDLVSEKGKRRKKSEDKNGSLPPAGGAGSNKQTRPLGEVRGGQEKFKLPELLPRLVEAVASKKPLKDNHLYSFEIEERTEDMTSGEVQVNRTNKWVFVNRNSYSVVDDQDTRLPQIGGEAAKVIHKDREKEFEANLKLASSRRQHKAWKELSSRRTTKFPLQFQIEMNPDGGINQDKQVLSQTRDSIRKILESRIVSSSIPSRSRQQQADLNSLSISNPAFVLSCNKGNTQGKWNSVSRKNSFQNTDSRDVSDFNICEEQSDEETADYNLDESQEIDDFIIEGYYEQKVKQERNLKTMSCQPKDITPRNETISTENDSGTVSGDDNDSVVSMVTSRPTSSLSVPSLPKTEGRNNRFAPERNDENLDKNTIVADPVRTKPIVSMGQGQSQGLSLSRASSARPTWPSLIDIQRLKSGGFRYRPSTSKGKGTNTRISTRSNTEIRQNASSVETVEKKDPPVKRIGTIIVPSHTTLDCPLCNLYSEEHSDSHGHNTSVYQHPSQVKGAESTKHGILRPKQRKVINKLSGMPSSTKGSHSTTLVINKVASKHLDVVKHHSEKAFPQRRPKSAAVLTIKRNPYSFVNQSVQIPVVSACDQIDRCRVSTPSMDVPCRFSYVKAPSNVNNEE